MGGSKDVREGKNRDFLAVCTILCLCITSIAGVLSLNFSHAFDVVNQYGDTVSLYGYGIYARDSYFKATISVGTDICILFFVVPLFLYSYLQYRKNNSRIAEMKLTSIYAVAVYYSASIAFGVTYNRLFLVYMFLFFSSLFGMFYHICHMKWDKTIRATRGHAIFLVLCGIALFAAWLPDLIPSTLHGGTLTLISVYTTEITYVIDMGIVSPLCFLCLYLLKKQQSIGTLIWACMLKLCIVVGVMMIAQTVVQLSAGVDLPIPVIATKSFSFVIMAVFAWYFNRRMYRELTY